ncbi:MAG: DUF952 domain-containing protein [Bacillota bacterium]|nr:DUF952 domain-containing protein [Bacillota bacterium]MDI7248651.1 DUF952 domain-containing protein [Bacillota bacterium]
MRNFGKGMDPGVILHITTREAWEDALRQGEYRAASLQEQGFIHCSTPRQVVRVANVLFRGQEGLILLCIDPDRLRAQVRWEALGTEEPFPHVYGPLNLEAVVRVVDFPAGEEGFFDLPESVKTS